MTNEELLKEIVSLPAEARRSLEDYLASIRRGYTKRAAEKIEKKIPLTEEPFFGMWADREDMADPTEWVRKIRREHWAPDRRARK